VAGEASEIRRDIAGTREEIDRHLQQLSGQVRGELDVERRARRYLPQLLGGMAAAGLFLGFLVGHRGRGREMVEMSREKRRLAKERESMAKQRESMAKQRGRAKGAFDIAAMELKRQGYDIP
jgi:hypothetical protein